MKKLAFAAMIGMLSASAFAAQGDILARFRVIDVDPSVSTTSTLSTINTGVKSAVVPELDFTYMITNNIGAELILGTSRHKATSTAFGDLGKVSVLPPTLTLQYHFMPEATFRPYVGAGINYTRFYSNDLKAAGTPLSIDQNSWGGALQLGADVAINKSWFVNVDVKKLWISTDVTHPALGKLGTLDINPWVFGIGIGTKF
ncbi:OmpW family protein [Chromobacterium phragmitis]|uniref:OmpW/AlkL family protein n=1 Tax=Chromobacterium amazonense TaxID=1382803 RepID=UPI0021B6EAC4|nr:OmpW family outer membrane protein [Chromobacterium amazonense]MBM2886287.1 OmpW family protein [Chromobacterium amazonense]